MILPNLATPIIYRDNIDQSQLKKIYAQAIFRMSPTFAPGRIGLVNPISIFDGGRGLSFSCGTATCTCSGDDDCNNMFSSGVCGDLAVCDESGGSTQCICLRF